MILERFFTWLIEKLYHPTVTYAKTFPQAIDPTFVERGFELYNPSDIRIRPNRCETINTGIIFEYPLYIGWYVLHKIDYLKVIEGKNENLCILNTLPTEVLLKRGVAIAKFVPHMYIRPKLQLGTEVSLSGERHFNFDSEILCTSS